MFTSVALEDTNSKIPFTLLDNLLKVVSVVTSSETAKILNTAISRISSENITIYSSF